MDRNELKAMLAELMAEQAEQAPKFSIAQAMGGLPVVGQLGGALGATISGVLSTAGSVLEGVSHVGGTASTAIGTIGHSLRK